MNNDLPIRKRVRLADYDYRTPGCYFVTLCTAQRRHHFADPALRQIAEACWLAIPDHCPHVELDTWVVMPNHMHGLLWIVEDVRPSLEDDTEQGLVPSGSLSAVIRSYKAAVTKAARQVRRHLKLWQANYHDRIVRDERALHAIRAYIEANPERWRQEREDLDGLLQRMNKR